MLEVKVRLSSIESECGRQYALYDGQCPVNPSVLFSPTTIPPITCRYKLAAPFSLLSLTRLISSYLVLRQIAPLHAMWSLWQPLSR